MRFLKARFASRHSVLPHLPCPVTFLLPRRTEKQGVDLTLPSGSHQSAGTGQDRMAGGREARRVPCCCRQGWKEDFQEGFLEEVAEEQRHGGVGQKEWEAAELRKSCLGVRGESTQSSRMGVGDERPGSHGSHGPTRTAHTYLVCRIPAKQLVYTSPAADTAEQNPGKGPQELALQAGRLFIENLQAD